MVIAFYLIIVCAPLAVLVTLVAYAAEGYRAKVAERREFERLLPFTGPEREAMRRQEQELAGRRVTRMAV